MGILKRILLICVVLLCSHSDSYSVELIHNRAGAPIKKDISTTWIKSIAADFLSQCNNSKLFVSGSSIYDFAGTAMNYAMLTTGSDIDAGMGVSIAGSPDYYTRTLTYNCGQNLSVGSLQLNRFILIVFDNQSGDPT